MEHSRPHFHDALYVRDLFGLKAPELRLAHQTGLAGAISGLRARGSAARIARRMID